MTKKRIATMATCIALVGAVAVGGTLALLSTQSNILTNTFAVGPDYPDDDGKIALELREHDVQKDLSTDNYGGYSAKENWKMDDFGAYTDIDYTQIVEGTTLAKDPQFHLVEESPNSWIVAEIDGLTELDGKLDVTAIPSGNKWYHLVDDEWVVVDSADDVTDGYYMYSETVAADGTTEALFTQLTATNVVDENGNAIDLGDIVVKGVAVQAVEGSSFNDATKAEVYKTAVSVLHPESAEEQPEA